MIEKILVPIDGSDHSTKAIGYAADLSKQHNAELHLLHVVKPVRPPEGLEDYMKVEGIKETPDSLYLEVVGNQILRAGEKDAKKRGVVHVETAILTGDPADRIVDYARWEAFDTIVIGSKELGNVSRKICQGTDQTCVIVRKGLLDGKTILAVDDEPDVLDTIEELLPMCSIAKASSFSEAKKQLETQDFDMAILDIMGVDGYKLLEIANEKKVISVMLTAHALSLEDTRRSYKEGAASFLPKDHLVNLATFLRDIFEAQEKGKHSWWRWFDRLGAYYHRKFGADLKASDLES